MVHTVIYFFMILTICVADQEIPMPLYILPWSLISLAMEWGAVSFGVFHYGNGYHLGYSFGVYLLVLSMCSALYDRHNHERIFAS